MQRPANIAVGQEVFVTRVSRSFNASRSNSLGKITKITPSGQVTVETGPFGTIEYRFGPNDRQIGGDMFLSWDVEAIKAEKIETQKMVEVEQAIMNVSKVSQSFRHTHGREEARLTIENIRAALEAAEKALAA